jgi:tetratricopeptide (TPR) repeat protein
LTSTSATHHTHHFDDLSPDDFERLVYWLLKRGAEFDEVQWYGGARDKGRDVVAHKHTPAGRETWYVQCKRYASITFATLRDELDKLAQHAAQDPGFRPDVVVFATACPVPPQAKDQAAVHAAGLGLPQPYYWGRLELDERLKAQPETEAEFFGEPPAATAYTTQVERVIGPMHAGSGDIRIDRYYAGLPEAGLPPYVPPPQPDPDILPEPGPLPLGSRLPFARNALFTGRAAPLKALARTLLHDGAGSTLVTQAVHGLGGIGKTQLAVEFAYRYGRYFHGVHWLDAAQPGTLEAQIAACGAAMVLPNWPAEQPEQVTRTLNEWQRVGPRLVILDNLEDVGTAREWLGRLGGGPVRLILTARRSRWPRDLGLAPLPLDFFTPPESHDFLREYLDQGRATDAELATLAQRLFHLPLALELAGRYLECVPRLPVVEYLQKLADMWNHPSMQGWRAELGNPTDHDLNLMVTFGVSWEQVQDGVARRLFLLAGHCAPSTPIPCDVLETAAGLDPEACGERLSTLTGLGLLEMADPAIGPLIHPLLAEYAKSLAAGDSEVVPVLADALARAAKAANDRMDETGSPAHFAPLLAHVRLVAQAAEVKARVEESAANLWENLGYYLRRVADYGDARAACERALAIDEAAFGPDHPNVATGVNNLGHVLHDLGDLAGARDAFQRALGIDETTFGPDHPNVARDVNNLGFVLKDLGDLAGAQIAFQRALGIDEAAFGPDYPNVAISINNLGFVLKDQGDLAGARIAFQRALGIDEAAFGPDHPNVATDVNNLGWVLHDLGDLAGARVAFQRALGIDEAAFGPDHPNVARDVNNLGFVLKDLGDLAGAWVAFQRALGIDEAVFGPDHPNVATDVNNLGLVLKDLGDLAGARDAFQRALGIFEQVLGPDHPNVATLVNNLGGVLKDLGDLAGARDAFQRALRIDEAAFGPDHPNVARDVNNLGSMLRDLGDLTGARDAFQRALRIDEAVFGPDHPNIATDVNNLGNVLQDLEDLAGARDAYERALEIDEAAFGLDHPNVARDVNNLGSVLKALGDLAGARDAFQRALRIFEKFLPPDHPNIQIVRRNLERLE